MQALAEDELISEPVAERSTSLLSDLAREIVRQRSIGLGNGGITLEDMVRELLRPILKEWLDENLPYMIERIIKKEIEKMVNRAENY
jgi:cell pole-organizing protein PopZ